MYVHMHICTQALLRSAEFIRGPNAENPQTTQVCTNACMCI